MLVVQGLKHTLTDGLSHERGGENDVDVAGIETYANRRSITQRETENLMLVVHGLKHTLTDGLSHSVRRRT